jgi:adhesin transport system outer membrane protein
MLCISLGSVLSSFPYVASAQENAISDTENRVDAILNKITLEKVLRIAAETHPSIAQRLSEQGASDYSVAGARWQRWPGVSMSSSRGPLGSTLTELQLEQPLWTGGRITANINAAEARADAARQSVLEARKTIIERAINAYAEAMRLQSRIAIADAAIEDFEALTGMIDRRVENGISPKADAVNVRARLQQANSERLQLQLQRRNTRTELELLIGQRFSELAVPQALLPAAISLEDAVHIALENAPELARLTAEERVAEETIAATRSSLSPSLSLRYQRIFGGGTLYATG